MRFGREGSFPTDTSYSLLPGDRAIIGTILGLYLYDTRSGKLLRQYRGHTGVITSLAYSPERRYLLSGSRDQTLCVWDLDHDQPLMSLFVAGNDWVAWTPQGYYAASPAGEELMGWHVNNGLDAMASFYPASQFRKTLYRPDVIKRLLQARSLEKALAEADAALGHASRPTQVAQVLPPQVAITAPANAKLALSADTLEVHAIAKSSGAYPVTALRLLLDGRPVHEGLKTFPNSRLGEARGSWTVAVPPGNHRLIVQADSEVSKGFSEPVEVARTCGNAEPAKGTLYVLAVGINAYPDKQLKLDCAAPDAQDLSEAFLNHSRRLFREIEPRLLLDGLATRAEIFRELRRLSATAKAGDVAVVFYAGHGKHMSQFYLVPVDANVSTLWDLGQSGIAGEDLRKEMGDLPCTTILMLDACEADSINDLLHEMVYESRVVVMCGAGKDQAAEEANGHGHFTRAIVEGMGGQAESSKDGQIGLLELQTYVRQRVLELSFGEQEPTIVIPKIVGSFPLSQPKRAEAHSTP